MSTLRTLALVLAVAALGVGCAGGAGLSALFSPGRQAGAAARGATPAPQGADPNSAGEGGSSQGDPHPSASPNWPLSIRGPVPSPKAIDPKEAVDRAKANAGPVSTGGGQAKPEVVASEAAATPAQGASQPASPAPARP